MSIDYPNPEIDFPSDLEPIATNLKVIDFNLIKQGNLNEIEEMWLACTGLSFFYLKNSGIDPQPMIELGKTTFNEKLDQKQRFPQGDTRYTFGYKCGFYDGAQIMNVGQDAVNNFLDNKGPRIALESCDSILPKVQKFMSDSQFVSLTILSILEKKLDLPTGTLLNLHTGLDQPSGSGARITMTPPLKDQATEDQIRSAEHFDFGTMAILFDNVGGLQFQAPGDSTWRWMKPIPGYASINTGDFLKSFTGGRITSLAHRVLPPPGNQSKLERFSPVYFSRPNWGFKA